jgi:hypothetical protein
MRAFLLLMRKILASVGSMLFFCSCAATSKPPVAAPTKAPVVLSLSADEIAMVLRTRELAISRSRHGHDRCYRYSIEKKTDIFAIAVVSEQETVPAASDPKMFSIRATCGESFTLLYAGPDEPTPYVIVPMR